MESWLKKGSVKRELDREVNESTVALTSEDGSSLVMKKVKKEEKNAALWDSYVSTRTMLHAQKWAIKHQRYSVKKLYIKH